jgi:perosamine synthetase
MVTVVLDEKFGFKKEELISLMSEKNIDCRPFFYPLSSMPAYKDLKQVIQAQQRNKNAYKISSCGINLPCGMNMTKEKVSYVCEALKSVLGVTKFNIQEIATGTLYYRN